MKKVKYLLSLAAMLVLATACNHDPDEIVVPSTLPEIKAHSNVVVNNNTESETFTLAWSPAKYGVATDVEYNVYATCDGGTPVLLGSTDLLQFSMPNGDILKAVGANIVGSYDLVFSLEAVSADGAKKQSQDVTVNFKYDKVAYIWVPGGHQGFAPESAPRLLQRVNGHFYGYINLEGTGDVDFKFTSQPSWDGTNYGKGASDNSLSTAADADNNKLAAGLYYFDVDLANLTYTAVSLTRVGLVGGMNGWGTPDIKMNYNSSSKTWTAIAKVSKGQEYKVRFNNMWDVPVGSEAWNLSLGGSKDNMEVASPTNLQAAADGIFEFTLSLADYPYTMKEAKLTENGLQLYVPSSANNWDYMSAPMLKSEVDKDGKSTGVYNGVLDFAANAEFVLAALRTPYGTQYGGALDNLVTYTDGAEPVKMSLAAGKYIVKVDVNAKTVTTSVISSVDVAGVNLIYDSSSKTWKATHTFADDAFYKVKVSAGATNLVFGGSNLNLAVGGDELYMKAGARTLELSLGRDVANTLKIDGTLQDFLLYPSEIGVTGDFSDISWNVGNSPKLPGNVKTGIYNGYVSMYGATYGFKFTQASPETWFGGVAAADGAAGVKMFTLGGNDNLTIAEGLYFWTVDLANKTAQAMPITRVGVIGEATPTGWNSDTEMTYDKASGKYKLTIALTKANIKIRFNSNWDYNLGGDPANLEHKSPDNIAVASAGTYDLTLDLAHTPYKLTMEKK